MHYLYVSQLKIQGSTMKKVEENGDLIIFLVLLVNRRKSWCQGAPTL